MWSKVEAPLAGPVPMALLFASVGALVPLAGLVLFGVRSGAVPALKRSPIPWFRIGIDVVAVAAATAAVSYVLHDGAPPLDQAGSMAAGLLSFCARFGGPTAPLHTQKRFVWGIWGGAMAGMVALGVLGPQWWPGG